MFTVAIVSSAKNGGKLLEQTILSVLSQVGLGEDFAIDYLVVDASDTRELSAGGIVFDYPGLRIVRRKDEGFYDGLAWGLQEVAGNVYLYLNAGDLFMPGALLQVRKAVEDQGIKWGAGFQTVLAEDGHILACHHVPRFKRKLLQAGAYGRFGLPVIQQESTFWVESLQEKIDFDLLRKFELAGDFFLWNTFAKYETLEVVESAIGGFRIHSGQLSEKRQVYRREMDSIAGPGSFTVNVLAVMERLSLAKRSFFQSSPFSRIIEKEFRRVRSGH